jgi:hypothetical protein
VVYPVLARRNLGPPPTKCPLSTAIYSYTTCHGVIKAKKPRFFAISMAGSGKGLGWSQNQGKLLYSYSMLHMCVYFIAPQANAKCIGAT